MHALLVELAGGGIAKEINASDVDLFLANITPTTPVEQTRYDLAVELLEDIRRLDAQLKASHMRIRAAIRASGTSVTELFGIGPIIAAAFIGYTGDVSRFQNRDRFAAYNGTAPVEFSSGGRTVHRLSERGNRQLNHAIHMAAICQLRQPHSEGRAYFERKVAEGKTTLTTKRNRYCLVSGACQRLVRVLGSVDSSSRWAHQSPLVPGRGVRDRQGGVGPRSRRRRARAVPRRADEQDPRIHHRSSLMGR